MDVRITRTGRDARLTLSGEIDFSCAPALEAALDREIGRCAAAAGTLLIDASGVTFVDLEVVAVLFRVTDRLSATGVMLASPSRIVLRVMALADEILPAEPTIGRRHSA